MGNFNPYAPRFELYNSDTTFLTSYNLKEKTVDPFKICVSFACENRGTEYLEEDDINEELDKNGINGFRFHNSIMLFTDELRDYNIILSNRITYLELCYIPFSPHQGEFSDLASCVKFFKNLKRLDIKTHHVDSLSLELFRNLSKRHLDYLNLKISSSQYQKLKKMNTPCKEGTFGDILLKLFENTGHIRLDDNIWRALMERPDVFYKAQEKAGRRILSLETILIDQPKLTEAHLEMFVSFFPNGKGTMAIREMGNPDKLSRLFEYANKNQWKFETIQIGWWPSKHPVCPCPTTNLHFWEAEYLPVIKQILQTNSEIKKISSGMDAVTCAQLTDLKEYIKNLGMEIDTDSIEVSDRENEL